MPVVIATVAVFLVAFLFGRAWLLLVPALGWPVFFLGLVGGVWGHGVGEGWYLWVPAVILYALLGVAAVAAGLLLHTFVFRALRSWRRPGEKSA